MRHRHSHLSAFSQGKSGFRSGSPVLSSRCFHSANVSLYSPSFSDAMYSAVGKGMNPWATPSAKPFAPLLKPLLCASTVQVGREQFFFLSGAGKHSAIVYTS